MKYRQMLAPTRHLHRPTSGKNGGRASEILMDELHAGKKENDNGGSIRERAEKNRVKDDSILFYPSS